MSASKPLILLADDSAIMHRAMALALKNSHYELLTCDNGQDALRLASERRPAVLLAAVEMPGMGGVELADAVRARPELASTRVILLCGSFDQVDEERLRNARADGRLWKPFEGHVLLAMLEALLKAPQTRPADPTAAGVRPPPPRVGSRLEESTLAPNEDFAAKLANETFGQVDSLEHKRLVEKTLPEHSIPAEGFELTGVSGINDPSISFTQSQQVDLQGMREPTLSMEGGHVHVPAVPAAPPSADLWDLPELQGAEATPAPIPSSAVVAPLAPTPAPEAPRQKIDLHSLGDKVAAVVTPRVTAAASAHVPTANEGELRALVRNEVEAALNSWLKERLEKELALVLAELEEHGVPG